MIKPEFKDIVFNDFKCGIVNNVHRKWKYRKLKKSKLKKLKFTSIRLSRFYDNYDKLAVAMVITVCFIVIINTEMTTFIFIHNTMQLKEKLLI